MLLLLHGDILPYVAPSAVSDVGPKILSLVSPLCFIPKSGYLVARKNGSLKKPFWGYWYFGFPQVHVLPLVEPGLRREGDERPYSR